EKYCSSSGPSGICFSHKRRAAYRGTFTTTNTSKQPLANYGIQAKHSITGNVITLNNISDQLTGSLSDQQILSKLTAIESIENSVFSLQKLTLSLQASDENMLNSLNTDETLLSQILTQEDLTHFKDDLTTLKQTIQTAITENQITLESLENTLNSIKQFNILQDTSELENVISLIKDNITLASEHIINYEVLNDNLVTVKDLEENEQNLLALNENLKSLFSQNLQTLSSLDIVTPNQKLEQASSALRDEVNVALALNENIEYKIITNDEGLYQTNTHNALAQTQSVTHTTSSDTIIDNITLPKGKYGLFLVNQASDHPYLVEANPRFTNYNTFISSDYMLSKLDYRPEHTLKRLGDAMFETQLVSSSVLRLSGSRYLEGYASELAQFQALMDNALSLQTSLDLQVGISLSKEQVAQLGKNIVWMVEREVEGHRVLVPEVYLASTNISSDGARIAAGEIDLVIQDALLNDGLIASEGNLDITTGTNLSHQNGTIASGGDMSLTSGGTLKNLSGTIKSGGNMTLRAATILNSALTQEKTYAYAQGTQTLTQKGKAAQITSGGDVSMEASGGITLANTHLNAMGDTLLSSTGSTVSIEALETQEHYDFRLKKGYNRGESITNASSEVDGKSITINANQVNVIASSMSASSDIVLQGEQGVNILASNNLNYQDTKIQSSSGFLGKKTKQDTLYKETVVQSTLDANNILIRSSDASVNLEAANLLAQENIIVDAKEDINVLAKQYKEGELHSVKKSSWGGLSKSASINKVDALNAQEAHLRTEALNIIMKSGKDIRVIGSNIDAASDLQLHAVNEVLIAAAQEFSKHEQWSKKSSFNLGNLITSLVTLGLADTGPVYAMELQHDQDAATSAKASSLTSGKGLYIDSGNTKILGSSLEAHDALHITASKGDIEILAAQETAQTSSHFEKKEVRLASIADVSQALNPKLPGEDTKLKITLAEATYDKETVNTQGLTHKSASLKSTQGDIVLDAQENIHVQGSTVSAQEDIRLTTQEGDIAITESIDTLSKDSKEKHASATISLTVQNEYVEIGSAIKAAAESAEQLKKVKDDYSNYKNEVGKLEAILGDLSVRYRAKEAGIDYEDIEDLRELIDHIKDNEKYYVAAIAAASADLASKTVAIAAQVATAAASSGTWGFSIGLALDLKGESLLEKAGITHSLASTFFAQNISIATGAHHDTTLSGSALVAKESLDITTQNLHVNASADTTTSNQESKDLSASLSVTMYGGGSGLGASLGYGQGHYSSQSTTHTNAELLAQNISIETTNDASFKGATVKADESLNINV
ncbi:MAG: hemagglutinin repeat-containing protein, partial [Campylobacterales bacterium]|nr:hemagglutinin repeat-containing protein [Campylobacterales bacterium]